MNKRNGMSKHRRCRIKQIKPDSKAISILGLWGYEEVSQMKKENQQKQPITSHGNQGKWKSQTSPVSNISSRNSHQIRTPDSAWASTSFFFSSNFSFAFFNIHRLTYKWDMQGKCQKPGWSIHFPRKAEWAIDELHWYDHVLRRLVDTG